MNSKEQNEQRLAAMPEAEIQDVLDRCVAYAVNLIASKGWRGIRGGVLPLGQEALDLVQAAFENLLKGGEWDADKPLWLVLQGYVRGTVSNLANSWENKVFTSQEDIQTSHEFDKKASHNHEKAAEDMSPLEALVRQEDDDLILAVADALEQGSAERRIVDAIIFGASKRAEVIEETGLGEKEYEAAKKRLRRFLDNLRLKQKPAHHNMERRAK